MHHPRRNLFLDLDGLLASSPWFRDLAPADRIWVRSRITMQTVTKGESLSRQGTQPGHWYGLANGMLKWSVLSADGHAVSLGGILPGCWFGEGGLLLDRPRQAEIIALQESQVALLPLNDFEHLLQSQASFKDFILGQLSERLYYFMDGITVARLSRSDSLVAYALCGLLHPLNNPLNLRRLHISQSELASLASVSRQRCNSALALMREKGWIRTEYGGLVVLNIQGLRTLAGLTLGNLVSDASA